MSTIPTFSILSRDRDSGKGVLQASAAAALKAGQGAEVQKGQNESGPGTGAEMGGGPGRKKCGSVQASDATVSCGQN